MIIIIVTAVETSNLTSKGSVQKGYSAAYNRAMQRKHETTENETDWVGHITMQVQQVK
jgi:hypothetical protein